ncbi:nucleoside hydrolase, partial [Rhizobium leguminosarum]|uniref:nucleoside hydrolase n=1 Tax=Rhizobium leguminosarum TaxID=384 RepID=UPI003F970897
ITSSRMRGTMSGAFWKAMPILLIGTAPAKAMVEMLEFFERLDIEKYGSDGGPLHDPTVVAYLLKPEIFQGRDCNVEIEVQYELTV